MSFIMRNPYIGNQHFEAVAQKLHPAFEVANDMPTKALFKKIRKICALKAHSPKKFQPYFNMAIYNLKNILKARTDATPRIPKSAHQLSDHAFCRILELVVGLDVIALKDAAMEELYRSDFEPIMDERNFVIKTIGERV